MFTYHCVCLRSHAVFEVVEKAGGDVDAMICGYTENYFFGDFLTMAALYSARTQSQFLHDAHCELSVATRYIPIKLKMPTR